MAGCPLEQSNPAFSATIASRFHGMDPPGPPGQGGLPGPPHKALAAVFHATPSR